MSTELAKVYDPQSVEKEIYACWIEAGAFDVEADDPRRKYCIVIPPPNVTAPLHLGHALNNTLQDILIRWRRMEQFATLWMPGTDHAGIATQTVVEKRILVEENRRRTDFTREQFVARVQAWKDEYEARIIAQLRAMGCSCDWRRTRFTMDSVCARAVRQAFFRLFADGLIYCGKRLVNWDPATQTVLADDEVEHETVHGHFWYMRYPLVEPVALPGGETLTAVTVATTRPETMLGDTAVAMNPADERAAALVGRLVRLPLVGRVIPIIADDHVVLPDRDSDDEKARFSTGFLKVTPAHDPDDYQIGERHLAEIASARRAAGCTGDDRELVFVNVMAPDGTISAEHGWQDARGTDAEFLLGMDRFEARQAVVEWFRRQGLLEDVRDYTHEVGHSYRSHVPVEPYLSDQWYVAVRRQVPSLPDEGLIEGTDIPVNSLCGLALKPLLDGRLRFTPPRYANTYRNWLEGLRDWPISRQLWWGHQLPVWYRDLDVPDADGIDPARGAEEPAVRAALDAAVGDWNEVASAPGGCVVRIEPNPDEPDRLRAIACVGPGAEDVEARLEAGGFRRDEDVLDTWFSSALWPFSTLGWPEPTPEMKKFYPGDVLCTAREIITLWVSRMVMMGQYCCGDIPFTDVFIHAMIQDGQGQKMSKSLGNGVDPNDIIHSHGADAMRFTLTSLTTQTQDVRMPVDLVCPHTGRTFAPKLITNKAGFRVAAPVQTSPDGRGKMVTTYGVASGEVSPTDEMPLARNTSSKFDIGRNFCNKLWNASRFALMNLAGAPAWADIRPAADLADAWILSRLNATVRDVTAALEGFRFNELAERLYHFMWDDLCDWYLEIAKRRIQAGQATPKAVLAHVLDVFLRLLHPVAPFITEAIWRRLNEVAPVRGPGDAPAEKLLVSARWPQADAAAIQPNVEAAFDTLRDLVRQVRNARTEHNVPPRKTVDALVEASGDLATLLSENLDLLRGQAGLGEVGFRTAPGAPPAGSAAVTAGGARLYVLGIIDPRAERARLSRQVQTLEKGIAGIERKLANENFLTRAPAEVVERERRRLGELRAELAIVAESLKALD